MIRVQKHGFNLTIKYADNNDFKELAELVTQFRSREDNEIPTEAGYCFDGGFIAEPITVKQHGGKLICASASDYLVHSIAIVCVGDLCSCPIPGHGVSKVMEGDADYIVEGKPVALAAHTTGCGAALISTVGDDDVA